MSQVRSHKSALPVFAALWLAVASYAQSDYGSMAGFVHDPSGGVIPKAHVALKNEATGTETTTLTNDSGYFVAANLPPGSYTLLVEAPGFKKFASINNKLDPNSTLELDATLAVGATTETVEVIASATPLQTESATVQKL